MQGRKTTTRAFRIDDSVDRQLREWAEREGVTASFLANKAIRRLVEWDMFAERFGFIAMPKEALSRMIEFLSEEEVRQLGRWVGENVYRAFTTFMFKHLDLETVLEVLPKLTSRYTKAFEYEEQRDGRRITIVLRHGRGRKYSLYYEEVARALFADMAVRGIRTEAQEDAVVLDFTRALPPAEGDRLTVRSNRGLDEPPANPRGAGRVPG